jgi:hypothetical protein
MLRRLAVVLTVAAAAAERLPRCHELEPARMDCLRVAAGRGVDRVDRAARHVHRRDAVPSGDQAVPYQAAPLVSWRWSWPAAFITQMSPQLGLTTSAIPCVSATYAIFEPSGLQSGTWSLGCESYVSCRWCEPSACISQTCRTPLRLLVKTIFVPFGEKAGYALSPASLVSCVRPVPSLLIT